MRTFLLSKLKVAKDRRQFEPAAIPCGRIRYLRLLYSVNMPAMNKVNILYILFVLPFLAVYSLVKPLLENTVIAKYNFSGNIGIGYHMEAVDSIAACKIELVGAYYELSLYLLPCIFLMGIASAGLFYVMRNFAWRVAVDKPGRAFFKGIKMYLPQFSVIFLVVDAMIFGVASYAKFFAIRYFSETAGAGEWIGLIAIGIVAIYVFISLIELLPMVCAYKFNLFDSLRNSAILGLYFAPMSLFVAALFVIPLAIIFAGSQFLALMLLVLLCMFGFTLYSLMWTVYGHYTFDLSINYMYNELNSPKKDKDKDIERKKAQAVPAQTSGNSKPQQKSYANTYKKKSKDKRTIVTNSAENQPVQGKVEKDNMTITIVDSDKK